MAADATQLKLIVRVSSAANRMKPGFQGLRTRWIRGFIAFRPFRRTRIVMLIVPE
jgi:hypothetical protein